jgi:hypothetical protein
VIATGTPPPLRVHLGSHMWGKIGKTIASEVGKWEDYQQVINWFRSQNAVLYPSGPSHLYYILYFDTVEDMTEFVLKWC